MIFVPATHNDFGLVWWVIDIEGIISVREFAVEAPLMSADK